MLKDHSEDHEPRGFQLLKQNAGRANSEVGLAALNGLHGIDIGSTLANFDIKARVPVITPLERRVVAGELKLMLPFELQGNLI
jgi:hypothetical protein